jgi:hypothetical protein
MIKGGLVIHTEVENGKPASGSPRTTAGMLGIDLDAKSSGSLLQSVNEKPQNNRPRPNLFVARTTRVHECRDDSLTSALARRFIRAETSRTSLQKSTPCSTSPTAPALSSCPKRYDSERRIAFLPSLVNLRRADTQILRFTNTVSLPFDFPRIRVCVRLSTFMRILIYYGLSQPAS